MNREFNIGDYVRVAVDDKKSGFKLGVIMPGLNSDSLHQTGFAYSVRICDSGEIMYIAEWMLERATVLDQISREVEGREE